MKKGLTYVDIAVSVGIFIIYGVFLFIMFRPAIEEEFDDEVGPTGDIDIGEIAANYLSLEL